LTSFILVVYNAQNKNIADVKKRTPVNTEVLLLNQHEYVRNYCRLVVSRPLDPLVLPEDPLIRPIVSVPLPLLLPFMVLVSVPMLLPPTPLPVLFILVMVSVPAAVESDELLLLPELLQLNDANATIAINNARLMVLVLMIEGMI
jgi:hypothetical protein